MADEMEIIIQAVDMASDVFQSIIGTASDMANGIIDTVNGAGDEFETVANGAMDFNDVISSIDTSSMEELATELGMDTEQLEQLIATSADMGNLSAGFNEAASAADELEQEIMEDVDAVNELGSAGDVMAAQTFMDMANGMKDSMLGMADSAGTFQDSINRASLEAEGAGVSVDAMKQTVSDLSETTGRAGGQIRESFIKATARGVTDMSSFKTMMKGAGAQAYLFGTDIQTMGDKFSKMAQKNTLMEKSLGESGITMNELATAMGMTGATADEVKDKWKELDTNQRAAILGQAASMNEGKNANEEYKTSWQGLQDQIKIARDRLEKLVGNVILPVLIPAMQIASSVLQAAGDTVEWLMNSPLGGLISIVGTAAGVFMMLVAGAAALRNILAFLAIETMLETAATTMNTIAKSINEGASIGSAIANELLAGSFMSSAAAAWSAAVAFIAATWPLWVIVGAIVAVVAVVYELGKAFGWWTDVSTMIEAIQAGVMELWNAFINHPDVQAAISVLTDVWNGLISIIQGAGQAVLDFFGINTGGNFDIVRAIIDNVGKAWNGLKSAAGTVIGVLQGIYNFAAPIGQAIYNALKPIICVLLGCSPGIVPALETARQIFIDVFSYVQSVVSSAVNQILSVLSPLIPYFEALVDFIGNQFMESWNTFLEILSVVTETIIGVITVFQAFLDGQISLQQALSVIWSLISNAYMTVISLIVGRVIQFASELFTYALTAGLNFLTGIVTYVSQLPGRVYSYLLSVSANVTNQATRWVNTARTKASQLVNGVISYVMSLPARVYSYLYQVVSRIISAGQQWVNNARNKAQSVVTNVINSISGLPGKVASAIGGVVEAFTKPFRDAWNNIKVYVDDIKNAAKDIPVIGGVFGGESADGRQSLLINQQQQDLVSGDTFDIRTGEYIVKSDNTPLEVNEEIKLILDLRNVPDGIDERVLIEALTSSDVIRALVENKEFQSLDAKVKDRILSKVKRARGV